MHPRASPACLLARIHPPPPPRSLILLSEGVYAQLRQQVISSQPPDHQAHLAACLDRLMQARGGDGSCCPPAAPLPPGTVLAGLPVPWAARACPRGACPPCFPPHLARRPPLVPQDVQRNLEPKNRDKFTQNLTIVRHDFRSRA